MNPKDLKDNEALIIQKTLPDRNGVSELITYMKRDYFFEQGLPSLSSLEYYIKILEKNGRKVFVEYLKETT